MQKRFLTESAGLPYPVMMMAAPEERIETLEARRVELHTEMQEIVDGMEEAEEDLTDEQVEEIEAKKAEIENIDRQLKALRALASAGNVPSAGRKTEPEPNTDPASAKRSSARVPASPRADRRTGGFANLGEFAATVYDFTVNKSEQSHNRLMNMDEGVGEDGGFLVPAEYRESIMKVVEGEESLMARTDMSTTSRNAVQHPKDETTPWGTSGIIAYWEGEADAATASGAKFQGDTLRLNKLFARVDVTDELLEDAPQLDNYLRVKAPEVMTSVINLAIVQGNGVGKPLGIMNSPALVTVAKETSQPADTIHHRNIINMRGRMYASSWPRSVWLMHQDVWSQLPLISFKDGTSTPVPAFMDPMTGISTTPFGTLLGRPIVVTEAMETIGDLGDIILADMSKYRTITKAGGARVDTSIHLKFNTDETVFRFIFRLAGHPWWSAPISHRDGANTVSPFVTLASR